MMRFAKASTLKACCQDVGLLPTHYYGALKNAERCGCREEAKRYLDAEERTTEGKLFTAAGELARTRKNGLPRHDAGRNAATGRLILRRSQVNTAED